MSPAGGGGALLIAESRDITISRVIFANGGGGSDRLGTGAGGAIRLVANRITLERGGVLLAVGDERDSGKTSYGRISLEAYQRLLSGTVDPMDAQHTFLSAPIPNIAGGEGRLIIESVAGLNVQQPPRGELSNPDVTFTAAGDVTVSVRATHVPDGTPVKLRLTMLGEAINKPAAGEPDVKLVAGKANFRLTVPKGSGTLQATTEFDAPQ